MPIACFFWKKNTEHLKIPTSSPPPPLLHEDLLVPWQGKRPNPSTVQTVGFLNFLKRLLSAKPQHRPEEQPLPENSGASSIVRMNQKRLKAFQMVHLLCLNKGCIQLLAVTPVLNLPSYQAFALCFFNSS